MSRTLLEWLKGHNILNSIKEFWPTLSVALLSRALMMFSSMIGLFVVAPHLGNAGYVTLAIFLNLSTLFGAYVSLGLDSFLMSYMSKNIAVRHNIILASMCIRFIFYLLFIPVIFIFYGESGFFIAAIILSSFRIFSGYETLLNLKYRNVKFIIEASLIFSFLVIKIASVILDYSITVFVWINVLEVGIRIVMGLCWIKLKERHQIDPLNRKIFPDLKLSFRQILNVIPYMLVIILSDQLVVNLNLFFANDGTDVLGGVAIMERLYKIYIMFFGVLIITFSGKFLEKNGAEKINLNVNLIWFLKLLTFITLAMVVTFPFISYIVINLINFEHVDPLIVVIFCIQFVLSALMGVMLRIAYQIKIIKAICSSAILGALVKLFSILAFSESYFNLIASSVIAMAASLVIIMYKIYDWNRYA